MPTVDVVDLNNQKVGELELADEVFAAEINEALLYEAVRHYQAGERSGTREDQDAARSGRLGQEAVEAEGHGPGAHGLDPVAAVAAWRHGARARSCATTATSCRARCCWARCARRFRPSCGTAN